MDDQEKQNVKPAPDVTQTIDNNVQSQSPLPQPALPNNEYQVSASQMGLNKPRKKLFDIDPKKLLIKGLIAFVILGGIFAALVATNVITLSEFKNISYTNSSGTHYKMKFYARHTSKQLQSGNTQLVSKLSKAGKFPINLSISNVNAEGYSKIKDCKNYTKVFDVQNSNFNQKISVCDFGKQATNQDAVVYVAGFTLNNQASIITIGQDYSSIDLSSQSGAQESLTKFGMQPYAEDIKTIVSSIKAE